VLVPVLTAPFPIANRENLLTAYGRILIGCVIALCLNDRRIFGRLRFLGTRSSSWLVLVAFGIALLLVEPVGAASYAFPFVAALLLVSIIVGGSASARVLAHPLVRYVGTRAYGMYLLDSVAHRVATYLTPPVTDWPTTLLFFVVSAAVALAFADVLYRVIEQPMIRVGKRVSRRLMQNTAAQSLRLAPEVP
jgi:peptidoglycan/LPS O-acetylase OafA/YrhL